VKLVRDGARPGVRETRADYLARLESYKHWEDTSDLSGEHFCHVHPLGATEYKRYWCGCTCVDRPCRRYMAVWLVTHPRTVVMHLLGRFANGKRR
jgi:hypothetical protein